MIISPYITPCKPGHKPPIIFEEGQIRVCFGCECFFQSLPVRIVIACDLPTGCKSTSDSYGTPIQNLMAVTEAVSEIGSCTVVA